MSYAMERNAQFLSRIQLFQNLNQEILARLGTRLKEKKLPKGSMLFAKDDPGNTLFMILEGEVKVVLYSRDGREIVLAKFGAGDFFGEMCILDEHPRSANAITLTDTLLLTLDSISFRNFLETEPTVAVDLLREISIRLRNTNEKVGDLALMDVYGRVARLLFRLAEEQGEETEGGILIRNRPTHQEMANMVGTARETVSRAMSSFQKAGYIVVEKEGLLLPDSEGFFEKFAQI